ncbi:zinc-dependent alcohol dehydrogenase family protein [Chitinophaga sp. Ak27]|uniref:zinc-dependent alcohol dehydrogenase family protein n=1 Tax=Chitinophaga sp. Ak27 TaxID=2726116 RepID=UPI002006E9AB|nr:zinc-dependent alcohol dehydrogenase family protein [Chitinophaga sp. Ak27]
MDQHIPEGAMRAMVLEKAGAPLTMHILPIPVPQSGQVLIKVRACGVCRTDLHIIDGELTDPILPLIPGHEVIGEVIATGSQSGSLKNGEIVGVPWLAHTCGHCRYCRQQQENLCEQALFTGYTVNGGYAEFMVAWESYCVKMPALYHGAPAAPLLCAGLIGYRSWRMMPPTAHNIGIYGFGAAAHILVQIATYLNKNIYAFTKPGDTAGQEFAKKAGAIWAGNSNEAPPVTLDGAIIFAPDGSLIPESLSHLDKGGIIVCGGIHMSNIPSFPYHLLWEERTVRSVANLTRDDAAAFFQLAPEIPLTTTVQLFPLHQANEALDQLRNGNIKGAAVLVVDR